MNEAETTAQRERFERWIQTTASWRACARRHKTISLRTSADGQYLDYRANDRWLAWKAALKYEV